MFKKSLLLIGWLILISGLNACITVQPSPTVAPTQDIAATQTAEAVAESRQVATSVAATQTAEVELNQRVATSVAATQAAQPTDTPLPTLTPTPKPSATPTSTPTQKIAAPTKILSPSAPPPTTGSGSIYSTAAGGPQGYTSTLGCTQVSGAACQPVMPPGDLSFSILLKSTEDALLAIFVPFGLAVEKDGANAADMYMTVDSGWLEPGAWARMGTSRKFSLPGHYIIRTNGCLITEASYPACTWWTLNGTVITFDIQ